MALGIVGIDDPDGSGRNCHQDDDVAIHAVVQLPAETRSIPTSPYLPQAQAYRRSQVFLYGIVENAAIAAPWVLDAIVHARFS